MGFTELKKDELLEAVEIFGTDVRPTASKADIIAALVEDGIDYETFVKFKEKPEEPEEDALLLAAMEDKAEPIVDEEDPVENEKDTVLLRMTRGNGTFEIRGYRFTREHPYAIVTEDDADYLIEIATGFRIASPKEARLYYQ